MSYRLYEEPLSPKDVKYSPIFILADDEVFNFTVFVKKGWLTTTFYMVNSECVSCSIVIYHTICKGKPKFIESDNFMVLSDARREKTSGIIDWDQWEKIGDRPIIYIYNNILSNCDFHNYTNKKEIKDYTIYEGRTSCKVFTV